MGKGASLSEQRRKSSRRNQLVRLDRDSRCDAIIEITTVYNFEI